VLLNKKGAALPPQKAALSHDQNRHTISLSGIPIPNKNP
jgi:hypothetical protein